MKTKKTLAGISVSILATLALLICTASSARAADDGDKKPATSAPSDTGPSDGDYCTVLYSTKLQGELKLTDAQQETIGKLKDRLKAMLENAANPGAADGPANTRARTLAKRGGTVLSLIGQEVKNLLAAEQDRKLKELYAKGTLRPIEVVAAEVHGRTPTLNYVAVGRVGIVCHYDEPAKGGGSSASPTLGEVRGRHAAGSFYRDTHPSSPPRTPEQPSAETPPRGTPAGEKAGPRASPHKKSLSQQDLADVMDGLKSGDSKRTGDALMQLIRVKPEAPTHKWRRRWKRCSWKAQTTCSAPTPPGRCGPGARATAFPHWKRPATIPTASFKCAKEGH